MHLERPLREDLKATLDARRDLGPDYEKALVESFADRLDETIAGRVRAELAAQGADTAAYRAGPRPKAKSPASTMTPIVLGSLGIGVPLTAIAAGQAGLLGLAITWIAIVVINVAAASAVMRRG
ncbi:hypothetical protein [Nonomuraea wenchangensis]|uniref:hypothetical protein n=1 Tax=Nonomuraea wenchangensis TaxID=568860 RepID=UPI00332AB1C5